MSYRVEFEGNALTQLHGLPADAFDALVERAVELTQAPWDAVVRPPGRNPQLRETTFGAGRGLLGFRVDDDAELIRIFDLTWIG